jgi:hypothetical protein
VNDKVLCHARRRAAAQLGRYTQRIVVALLCATFCTGCATTGQSLYVACSLSPEDGWSHLERAPDGNSDMRGLVASRIKESRSDGRRRLEWFANADGQLALCATWPRPNFCFTEIYKFTMRNGAWLHTNEQEELAPVVCTS